jgi:tetratricopeptide (TPR) repeat protein
MLITTRRSIALTALLGLAAAPGCGAAYQSAWDEPQPTTRSAQASTEEGRSRRSTLLAEAEEAWGRRDDVEQVRAAIRAWEQAAEIDGTDADTWVKLARAHYFLADGHLRFTDEAAMGDVYQQSIQAAERALRVLSPAFAERMAAGDRPEQAVAVLEANAVPALYWRAAALGKWAQRQGFATVLSYKDEIRAVMTRCMTLDRYYFFAGPDRYFGAFFSIAPSYAGGDLDLSRQHFEESLRRYPNYLGTRVLYAENYAVKAQNRQLFVEQLTMVIEADPAAMPEAAPENRIEQRKARDLLARADDLFE